MEYVNRFGLILRTICYENHMTQNELAKILGTTGSEVSKAVHGHITPPIWWLQKIEDSMVLSNDEKKTLRWEICKRQKLLQVYVGEKNPNEIYALYARIEDWKNGTDETLNRLSNSAYKDAAKHGLYEGVDDVPSLPLSAPKLVQRIREEVSEAYEAASDYAFGSDKELPHLAEEMADIIIMTLSACAHLGINIAKAVRDKMEINKKRPWKHGKEG